MVAMAARTGLRIFFALILVVDGTSVASHALLVAGMRIDGKLVQEILSAERVKWRMAGVAILFPGRVHRGDRSPAIKLLPMVAEYQPSGQARCREEKHNKRQAQLPA